ncbi:MAG: transposase [Clostridiaceae bacterium]|nr:transposase [Clostridiaceae bacterium]
MSRKARQKSESGIYHIILRGINRQTIFEDEEDHIRFLQSLQRYRDKCGFEIYAYCLMGNHVHLLIKVCIEPLEQIMRRICGSYVYWYNLKYSRIGNLFQDRFKSEPVENNNYFLTVLRYIHQNPIKAGLAGDIRNYMWSSYIEYLGVAKLITVGYAFKLLNTYGEKNLINFVKYNNEINTNLCLDINERKKISDEDARNVIKRISNVINAVDLQTFDIPTRNKYLKELKEQYSMSIRQIERLTGINRGVVNNA